MSHFSFLILMGLICLGLVRKNYSLNTPFNLTELNLRKKNFNQLNFTESFFIDFLFDYYQNNNNKNAQNSTNLGFYDLEKIISDLQLNNKQCPTENRLELSDNLAKIYSLNSNQITKENFKKICPSLIYILTNCSFNKSKNTLNLTAQITSAEKYGYGTLAILFVSLLALLGIFLLPCFKKSFYEEIIMALTSLGVGTLISDAMLHILPEILGVETENSQNSAKFEIPPHIIKICILMLTIYAFWILEKIVHRFGVIGAQIHGHSHSVFPAAGEKIEMNEKKLEKKQSKNTQRKQLCLNLKKVHLRAWIILIGDAIHNFADGLAVGAAFSQSLRVGFSTTVAIMCHEIPHELGNYAILITSGFSHLQALMFNCLSATTCLLGFYVGASVSTDPQVNLWIFTLTAGMFIYISLVDLLPSVLPSEKWTWKMFTICNLAILTGFLLMFLLVLFETYMKT